MRDAKEPHKKHKPGHPIAGSGANRPAVLPTQSNRQETRIVLSDVLSAVNNWLNLYYHRCGRRCGDSLGKSRIVHLRANEIVRITRKDGAKRLLVEQGIVWLTETPALGDTILRAGESFNLENNWPFVVQSIGAAGTIVLL